MASDNTFLPPIIHLGYLPEDEVIGNIRRAKESLRFVGPGLSKAAAVSLADQWMRLGPHAVEVVLDPDPELSRLGFCDGETLRILFETASSLGTTVWHRVGIRLCVLEVDGERIVYAPTPRLVEESEAETASIILSPNQGESLDEQILAPREMSSGPLTDSIITRVEADLKDSPPQDFDLARQIRVLSTEFQFVEFSLKGAALSRKRVDVPTDLLGLAPDEKTKELLRANFQLIGKADEVSGETLMKRRADIEKDYLNTIAHFGTVILKSNRSTFDNAVAELKKEIDSFQQNAEVKLTAAIDKNCTALCDRLLPEVMKMLPQRWVKTIGPNPSEGVVKKRLEKDLKSAYGDAKRHLGAISLRVVYKDVTSEMLTDSEFKRAAKEAKIDVEGLHERFHAARTRK
jgi:hypothetical protein